MSPLQRRLNDDFRQHILDQQNLSRLEFAAKDTLQCCPQHTLCKCSGAWQKKYETVFICSPIKTNMELSKD